MGTEFNGDVSDWDVSSVKDMTGMFVETRNFNGDVSDWDVSSVKYMSGMFYGVTEFNSDVSDWDVSSVTDMYHKFAEAKNNGYDSFYDSFRDVTFVEYISRFNTIIL